MALLSIYDDFQAMKTTVSIPEGLTIADPLEPDSKKRFILVSDLIPRLQDLLIKKDHTFLPILSVHCRRDPGLPCVMPTGKYTIKHLTPKTNPTYLLIEAHGRYREDPLVLPKGLFEDDGLHEHLQTNIFYRAPIGSRCRQLEYHQIYDNDISCRKNTTYNPDIPITNDALMIEGMRISIRHMTHVCDVKLQTQGTLCNQFTSPLRRSFSLPRRGSIPYGASPLSSNRSQRKKQKTTKEPDQNGGTIKKRKKRKPKTRNRRR